MNKIPIMVLVLVLSCTACRSYDNHKNDHNHIILDKFTGENHQNITENQTKFDNFIDKITKKNTLTLEDCYAIALLYNEKLKITEEEYLQSILEKDKAYSLVLPTLKLKLQHFEQETVPSFGGSSFSPKKRTEYWMTFSQPIFSGLKDIYLLRATKMNILSKEYSLKYGKIEIFLLVVSTFYEILKLQQQIKILEDFLKVRQERLQQMRERQKLGLVRETEVLLIETQIQESNTILIQSRNNLEILKSRMNNITGININNKTLLDTYKQENIDTLENLVKVAEKNRYDLKSQEKKILALKEQLKAIKGEYLPAITLTNNTYLKRSGSLREIDWDVIIFAELPIFEGFLTKTKIKEGESKIKEAQYVYDLLKKTIKEEVEVFYYEIKSNEAVIAQLEKQVEFAQRNYELLKEEYARKIATNLELLFADISLQDAKMRLETEKLNRKALQLKLNAITGKIYFE